MFREYGRAYNRFSKDWHGIDKARAGTLYPNGVVVHYSDNPKNYTHKRSNVVSGVLIFEGLHK